jgi:hypothetical protein
MAIAVVVRLNEFLAERDAAKAVTQDELLELVLWQSGPLPGIQLEEIPLGQGLTADRDKPEGD